MIETYRHNVVLSKIDIEYSYLSEDQLLRRKITNDYDWVFKKNEDYGVEYMCFNREDINSLSIPKRWVNFMKKRGYIVNENYKNRL